MTYLETGRYKNSFEEICLLGKGGFGIAYKVRHKLDSNFYCIKKIRLHLGYNQDIKEHKVYREIMALPKLNHKNVVRYFGCWAERIEMSEQQKIDDRVKKIKSHICLNSRFKKHINGTIKEKCSKRTKNTTKDTEANNRRIAARDLNNSSTDEVQVKINDIDLEADLDDAFDKSYSSINVSKTEDQGSNEDFSLIEDEKTSEKKEGSDSKNSQSSFDEYSSYGSEEEASDDDEEEDLD